MDNLDKQLQRAKQEIDHLSKTSPTEAGQANSNGQARREALVDTINQIFSLFRVNYHNQFYAAFNDSETLNQAKRMWLNATEQYETETLLKSTKSIIENSEYLPTLNQFLKQCDELQFHLPSDYEAYREACHAADRLSTHHWSHPAIYHAGKATGWQTLRSLPEKQVFPAFKAAFEKQKQQLRHGQCLPAPEQASTKAVEYTPLPAEEQKKRLKQLRADLALDNA